MSHETLKYTSRAQRVYDLVKDAEVGTLFSFEQLSRAAGTDTQRNRTVIHDASDDLWEARGCGLESVRGDGYKVVGSNCAAELMRRRLRKVKRQTGKGSHIGRHAQEDRMDPEERKDFSNLKHGFEVIQKELRTVQQRVDRVEETVRQHDRQIDRLTRRNERLSDADVQRVAAMVAKQLQDRAD